MKARIKKLCQASGIRIRRVGRDIHRSELTPPSSIPMDHQQQERMKELGQKFVLNEPHYASFYRDVVGPGLAEGYAVVSALICGDEVVATTMGLRHGPHYTLMRNSNAGAQWSNCSPALLCIERTTAALHWQGVRYFDLSIGNHDYKRRFGASPSR